jgi:DNA-binding MarR family transcriptional regulator
MSTDKREELTRAIGYAITRWQDASETFDETVGAKLKLSSAERRCLSFITYGPQTASAIARDIALTPAAVTSLIDRLEARGFVHRRTDPTDRRKVLVEAADKTKELNRTIYMPVYEAGVQLLLAYSLDEMALIRRFIEEVTVMQQGLTDALEGSTPAVTKEQDKE